MLEVVQRADSGPAEQAPGNAPAYTALLERLLQRASWLGRDDTGIPRASFTSVFLAFFASGDEFSRWVQDKAAWIGPSLEDVIRRWDATSGTPGRDLARVTAARQLGDEELAAQPVTKTTSIESVLTAVTSRPSRAACGGGGRPCNRRCAWRRWRPSSPCRCWWPARSG